jgi:hypothetical protein
MKNTEVKAKDLKAGMIIFDRFSNINRTVKGVVAGKINGTTKLVFKDGHQFSISSTVKYTNLA